MRSGVNCTRLVLDVERGGEAADEQRLGDARHALEQDVAAAEQGDEQPGDRGVLADDGLGHLGAHGEQRRAGAVGPSPRRRRRAGAGCRAPVGGRRPGRRPRGIRAAGSARGGGRWSGGRSWVADPLLEVGELLGQVDQGRRRRAGAGPNRMSADLVGAGARCASRPRARGAAVPAPRPTASRRARRSRGAGPQHGGRAVAVAGPCGRGARGSRWSRWRARRPAAARARAVRAGGPRARARSTTATPSERDRRAGPGRPDRSVDGPRLADAGGRRGRRVDGWYQTSRGVEPSARTAGPALLSVAIFSFVQAGPRPTTTVAGVRRRGVGSSTIAAPKAPSGSGSPGGPSSEGTTKHGGRRRPRRRSST